MLEENVVPKVRGIFLKWKNRLFASFPRVHIDIRDHFHLIVSLAGKRFVREQDKKILFLGLQVIMWLRMVSRVIKDQFEAVEDNTRMRPLRCWPKLLFFQPWKSQKCPDEEMCREDLLRMKDIRLMKAEEDLASSWLNSAGIKCFQDSL